MKLLYFLYAFEQLPTSLRAFQHITLRQDTRCVISDITLRRHGLLQRLARAWEKRFFISDSSNRGSWDITKGKVKKPDVEGKAKDEEACRIKKRWWTKLAPF